MTSDIVLNSLFGWVESLLLKTVLKSAVRIMSRALYFGFCFFSLVLEIGKYCFFMYFERSLTWGHFFEWCVLMLYCLTIGGNTDIPSAFPFSMTSFFIKEPMVLRTRSTNDGLL